MDLYLVFFPQTLQALVSYAHSLHLQPSTTLCISANTISDTTNIHKLSIVTSHILLTSLFPIL